MSAASYRRRMMVGGFLGVGLLVASAGSCRSADQQGREMRLANTGQPALHGVHAGDLQEAMQHLDRQASDQLRAELETGLGPVVDMKDVEKAAASIAASAERIPDVLDKAGVSEDDRRVMGKLAEKLKAEASALGKAARQNDLAEAKARMETMMATCNACHTMFRVPQTPK